MKNLITQFLTWLTVLLLGFALGYVFNKRETIIRAQEVLKQEKIQFDASDISYIAIGEKSE